VVFLVSQNDAKWIHIERPFNPNANTDNERVIYRKHFHIENVPPDAILTISALRSAAAFIDNQVILLPNYNLQEWKKPRSVNLSQLLTVGEHEIRISVFNENGPAILLAYCRILNLFTGEGWEASYDGINWLSAIPTDKITFLELSRKFPGTYQALRSLKTFYLLVFLGAFLLTLFLHFFPKHSAWFKEIRFSPSAVRWILIFFWSLLAVNNITKIPIYVGYDVPAHYEYISYVAETWTVPLATQGWQMFQSPLYYFVSAILKVCLSWFYDKNMVAQLLRIIPLSCGALQVELCYRAVRYVFPTRKNLQIIGTIVGGLLPLNIYMSQTVGNEPLAGLFTALVLVISLSIVRSDNNLLSRRQWVFLGIALGLALLTKATSVLLIPPLMLLIFYVISTKQQHFKSLVEGCLAFGIAFVISGWYYLRNWIELGKPFVGGWESSRWWQDPGYRTVEDFISFGVSLFHPIYAAIYSFWDSIYSTFWLDGSLSGISSYDYRPPWNYNFMLSSGFFALIPTAGILIGILRIISRPVKSLQNGQLFPVYVICIYLVAMLYLFLSVPFYCTAQARYTLGLMPCYVVVCAVGLDVLTRSIYGRALVNAFLSCWAISVYLSYLVW